MILKEIWYGHHWLFWPLAPLSGLYRLAVWGRRLAFRRGWFESWRLPLPVVVVGNLTVGGTGKTPLVLWLSDFLRRQGWKPGIILRGYGGSAQDWPRWVTAASDPRELGDEAVLLAQKSGGPVVAGPDRVAAGRLLGERGGCDIILADDGLQHYRLQRDLEILVIDGARGFGNGFCLPAGPLREPISRGRGISLQVCTGGSWPGAEPLVLLPGDLVNLHQPGRTLPLANLRHHRVTAVAGIGNPERFFAQLRQAGLHLDERPYPDHYDFTAADVATWPPGPVIMTEKDAVKCLSLAGESHWFLPVEAVPSAAFEHQLSVALKGLKNG
jgi:tetraacyldisaccharide 4'-kinase